MVLVQVMQGFPSKLVTQALHVQGSDAHILFLEFKGPAGQNFENLHEQLKTILDELKTPMLSDCLSPSYLLGDTEQKARIWQLLTHTDVHPLRGVRSIRNPTLPDSITNKH